MQHLEIVPSLMCHQAKGSSHAIGGTCNFLNKVNSPLTSACEDSSTNVPTPNILMSSSSCWLGSLIFYILQQ
jgi:hypothetical protein